MARILLVDDDSDLIESFRLIIEAQTALSAVTAASFDDVIRLKDDALACESAILDINLGFEKPNGIDVYHWLRANGFNGPISFLTGHGGLLPDVAAALKLGDVTVFSKPVGMDVFLGIVRGGQKKGGER